jgi:hypothetical protein
MIRACCRAGTGEAGRETPTYCLVVSTKIVDVKGCDPVRDIATLADVPGLGMTNIRDPWCVASPFPRQLQGRGSPVIICVINASPDAAVAVQVSNSSARAHHFLAPEWNDGIVSRRDGPRGKPNAFG